MTTNLLTTRNVETLTVALMAAQRAARFGARMKERRKELGLSQSAVADRFPGASVTKDYISRWELGKVDPRDDYVELIADALETTVADLMAGPVAERVKERGPTPDLSRNGSQLDRIEAELAEVRDTLDELVSLLSGQEIAEAVESGIEGPSGKPGGRARKSRAS